MSVELSEAEVFDLLDLAVSQRYGVDAVDFLSSYSEGTAEMQFPGCEDLFILAAALEGEGEY